jgi:homoserine kinase
MRRRPRRRSAWSVGDVRRTSVTVVVPATSANLGPGFDSLGLALGLYDEVTVRVTDAPGLAVEVTGEGADVLARDGSHLVARTVRAAFERFGTVPAGLSVRCANHIPQGRGLGSSAAAIVAGVMAAAALSGDGRIDDAEVLAVAGELEGHPDNVAACLLGGFTIAWTDAGRAHGVRLDPVPRIRAVVFVPPDRLSTQTARGLLPATVPHRDATHAASRAALAVAALTARPDLLLAATEDRLHQPYRATAMPATAALMDRLRAAGVAAFVSGAGPSVLALLPDERPDLPALAEPGWSVTRLALDLVGARLVEPPGGTSDPPVDRSGNVAGTGSVTLHVAPDAAEE